MHRVASLISLIGKLSPKDEDLGACHGTEPRCLGDGAGEVYGESSFHFLLCCSNEVPIC